MSDQPRQCPNCDTEPQPVRLGVLQDVDASWCVACDLIILPSRSETVDTAQQTLVLEQPTDFPRSSQDRREHEAS